MKHVWIRSLTLTAVSVCIVALSTGGVQLYTDEQKMDSYTRLEAGALLEEIDHMAASGETETSDDILMAAAALAEKAGRFTDANLLAVLEIEKYQTLTKVVMLQLSSYMNNGNGIVDSAKFKDYIADDSLDTIIRANLIYELDIRGDEDVIRLSNLVRTQTGDLAIISMKKLYAANRQAAVTLADNIVSGYAHYTDDAVRAAVKIKSLEYKEQGNDASQEATEFMEFCQHRFSESTDERYKDTMIYAMAEMGSLKAMDKILSDETIDRELKVWAVDQNYPIMTKVLKESPSADDMNIILSAMEILPIKQIAPLIRANKSVLMDSGTLQKSSGVSANGVPHPVDLEDRLRLIEARGIDKESNR